MSLEKKSTAQSYPTEKSPFGKNGPPPLPPKSIQIMTMLFSSQSSLYINLSINNFPETSGKHVVE